MTRVFTQEELIAVERLDQVVLARWIERRWVLPVRQEATWVFTEADRARVRLVRTLTDDLEIDDDTVPVLLSLIDQVHGLRAAVDQLVTAIADQPESVRRRILERIGTPGRRL